LSARGSLRGSGRGWEEGAGGAGGVEMSVEEEVVVLRREVAEAELKLTAARDSLRLVRDGMSAKLAGVLIDNQHTTQARARTHAHTHVRDGMRGNLSRVLALLRCCAPDLSSFVCYSPQCKSRFTAMRPCSIYSPAAMRRTSPVLSSLGLLFFFHIRQPPRSAQTTGRTSAPHCAPSWGWTHPGARRQPFPAKIPRRALMT
jgi:hypothetical protein